MKLGTVKPIAYHELKSAFVAHEYQRTLVPGKIRNYMASMRKYGFWKSHPIVWYSAGAKKVIIWGHHRREAALALKIGAFVQEVTEVTTGDTVEMITAENWSTWKTNDSLKLQVKLGNPDYITLQAYINRGLNFAVATSLLSGVAALGRGGDIVRSGKFIVKTTDAAEIICGFVERMKPVTTVAGCNGLLMALEKCLRLPKFSLSELEKRILQNPSALERRTNIGDYLKLIESIFNFNNRNAIPLAFLADQDAKNRSRDTAGGKEAA